MIYRKFNIVLCAIFAFIQLTTFCGEEKYIISFVNQNDVYTSCDVMTSDDNADLLLKIKENDTEKIIGKFVLNRLSVKIINDINIEEENVFTVENTNNEKDKYSFKSSKATNKIIQDWFQKQNIQYHLKENNKEKVKENIKANFNDLQSKINEKNEQLNKIAKEQDDIRKEQKELNGKVQVISKSNNSLIESFNKQVEESGKQATKLEEQRQLQEKAIGNKIEEVIKEKLKELNEDKIKELIEKLIPQAIEAQKKPKRLGEKAAEKLQESSKEMQKLRDKQIAKESNQLSDATKAFIIDQISKALEKQKDGENIINSPIKFSIYSDKGKEQKNIGKALLICIEGKYAIIIPNFNKTIDLRDNEIKELRKLLDGHIISELPKLVEKEEKEEKIDEEETQVLIDIPQGDNNIKALLTIDDSTQKLIFEKKQEKQDSQQITNGWSKGSRIFAAGSGLLVVFLGILYGYMNYHNLTFSNVLHAYN